MISPDYFKVMKMPILRGRAFGPEDGRSNRARSSSTIVLPAGYFPNQNPIGQHIDDNQTNDPNPPPLTIVGVVPRVRSDVPGEEFDRLNLPQMYFCAAQMATYENNLLVRVKSGDPRASSRRRSCARCKASIPISRWRTSRRWKRTFPKASRPVA